MCPRSRSKVDYSLKFTVRVQSLMMSDDVQSLMMSHMGDPFFLEASMSYISMRQSI